MRAKREYRSREQIDVAILDALVDRSEDGMTVFELRTQVDEDIDDIETALARLKDDDLIAVEAAGGRTVILPDDRVVPEPGGDDHQPSLLEELRRRLPF